MMHAAESPWMARPVEQQGRARAPLAKITSTEPTMPRTLPRRAIRTRPILSASPPKKTMNRPENRAVIETARFIWLRLMYGFDTWSIGPPLMSVRMLRAIVPTVPANSQNVRTPSTMPARSLSLPLNRCPLTGTA